MQTARPLKDIAHLGSALSEQLQAPDRTNNLAALAQGGAHRGAIIEVALHDELGCGIMPLGQKRREVKGYSTPG